MGVEGKKSRDRRLFSKAKDPEQGKPNSARITRQSYEYQMRTSLSSSSCIFTCVDLQMQIASTFPLHAELTLTPQSTTVGRS